MKQPSTTTTTTEMWQWQWQCGTCRADWKMLRQVTTTCCPHGDGGRCCQGQVTPPPSAGNPSPHHHHHHHRREDGASSRALAAGAEGSNADAGRHTTTTTTLMNPAPPVVAELCWVPDPYLMVQQLREFESLNADELVALRVQLQEYAEEIHRSSSRGDGINAGTGMNINWLLDLPPNVRDVVILARDVIESFIAISTASAPPAD